MVKDFHIPTEVRVIPTTREPSGLAMSSRNLYLGERRRSDAAILSRALMTSQKLYHSGVLSAAQIRQAAFDVFESGLKKEGGSFLGSGPIEVDYISLTRLDDMVLIKNDEDVDPRQGAILSAAMKVLPVSSPRDDEERRQIAVRLIDNVILEPRV